MEYKTITELERAAAATSPIPVTRADRLRRWADALDRLGRAPLNSLWRIEHLIRGERPRLRGDNSPFSVAFEDPVLRVAGLKDDSYGEAQRFFQLTDHELHWIVCSCNFGRTVSADEVASRVHMILTPPAQPLTRWLLQAFFGRHA